ncbi:hypothetical protein SAMD00019534_095680 [Acytostelium subglobosum LB1]|uniref:hypothetical protein n=1 Tax=Acytostelium subglobosum LB1 TaxID=1410327 RepID=UPI000645135C|nr:hypothetical protein SAMD00019534_095680 [Acytostelium subglobosum LB1]GAM26393.1 hypothetical protein SAMD00019534_095680 [Acytostelium subglobosum LB1]|eukprot:XP_012750489.1 hypothetical protein SAMD00019534_095680 [Acytostelium subglobosum LB1]
MGKDVERQPLLAPDEDSAIGIDKSLNNSDASCSPIKNKSRWWTCGFDIKLPTLTRESMIILLYCTLYVVSGVINSVLLKLTMNSFSNYGFFLNQLTNYGYIPVFGSVVAYKIVFTNDIPAETRAFPKYKFLIMGALDAVSGYFVIIGGISTSGPLQQLLNQAIIPITMIGSFFFLKTRYSWVQLLGATVIIGGVFVALVPSLFGKGENSGNKPFWNLFYLISMIPMAASNVYKDIGFQAVDDMDVWYLQFWDNTFQGITGTFLFPINDILPPPATVKFSQVIPSLRDGAYCLSGINSITNITNPGCAFDPPAHSIPCDNCHNAYIIIMCYMAINIIYNVFILLVIKHAGATVYSIANTLRLPIANIVFSLRFIVPESIYQAFSMYTLGGLIVILTGLIMYRVGSVLKSKEAGGEEKETRVIPGMEPFTIEVIKRPAILPKTTEYHRNQFFGKLGINVPGDKYIRLDQQNNI